MSQREKFIRAAREIGCDEDPQAFERVFARVVPPRKRPETATVDPDNKHAKRTATKRRLKPERHKASDNDR